jgi:hypothetical protein
MNEEVVIVHANGNSDRVTRFFAEIHGLNSTAVSAEEALQQTEPQGDELVAALWKLGVGHTLPLVAGQTLAVLSSDIEYLDPQGVSRYKANRMRDQMNDVDYENYLDDTRDEIAASFERSGDEEEITVLWLIAFGLQFFWLENEEVKASDRRVVQFKLRAKFSQPPTPNYIKENFAADKNPGFSLVELATPDRAILEITSVTGDTNEVEEWIEVPHDLVEMMIVNKIIPPTLLSQLKENESRVVSLEGGEVLTGYYQQVSVSLLGLV